MRPTLCKEHPRQASLGAGRGGCSAEDPSQRLRARRNPLVREPRGACRRSQPLTGAPLVPDRGASGPGCARRLPVCARVAAWRRRCRTGRRLARRSRLGAGLRRGRLASRAFSPALPRKLARPGSRPAGHSDNRGAAGHSGAACRVSGALRPPSRQAGSGATSRECRDWRPAIGDRRSRGRRAEPRPTGDGRSHGRLDGGRCGLVGSPGHQDGGRRGRRTGIVAAGPGGPPAGPADVAADPLLRRPSPKPPWRPLRDRRPASHRRGAGPGRGAGGRGRPRDDGGDRRQRRRGGRLRPRRPRGRQGSALPAGNPIRRAGANVGAADLRPPPGREAAPARACHPTPAHGSRRLVPLTEESLNL